MEQQEAIEMQLWGYIDGVCNEADTQRIAILIATDTVWQEKYNELTALHTSIAGNLETEQPSMRFTQNIMEAIADVPIASPAKKYINRSIIRGIAALFILAIGTMLIYALATVNWSKPGTTMLAGFSLSKFELPKVFSGSFFNVVIAVNIILGLMLVDIVLRRKKTPATS